MRSRHAEQFNHDDVATGYDADVEDESHPIRAGYSKLLDWVAARASITADASVLELGSGTGNLSRRLGRPRRLVCVDVSMTMHRIARAKLGEHEGIEFLRADLLECFEFVAGRFDAVVSTYAVHHLTPEEKSVLLQTVASRLEPGGVAVFGDLMFEHPEQRRDYVQQAPRTRKERGCWAITTEPSLRISR